MEPVPLPIDAHLADGREFTIEPITARTPDGPRPAVRIWHEGSVVDSALGDTHEEAIDKAFAIIKTYRKGHA